MGRSGGFYRYTTYANYIMAFSYLAQSRYGLRSHTISLPQRTRGIVKAGRQAPGYCKATRSKSFDNESSDISAQIGQRLRSAWLSEKAVRKLVLDDSLMNFDLLPMVFTQCYYAVRDLASIYLWITRGAKPETHEYILRELAQDVTRGMIPPPWDSWASLELATRGTSSSVPAFKAKDAGGSLAIVGEVDLRPSAGRFKSTESEQHVKRCLRSTGEKSHRFKRMRPSQIETFTVFDFLYRLRVNSNYSDIDMFLEMLPNQQYEPDCGKYIMEMTSDFLDVLMVLINKTAGREFADKQVEEIRPMLGSNAGIPALARPPAFQVG